MDIEREDGKSDEFFSEMGPIRNAKKQYLKYYGID